MMLKKAPKANKKTVLEEIAKLEKELDEKHQLELASFGTVGETEPDETLIASSVEEVPKLKKKSRAQKRRVCICSVVRGVILTTFRKRKRMRIWKEKEE